MTQLPTGFTANCPKCDGTGMRLIGAVGTVTACPCPCRVAARYAQRVRSAAIPLRLQRCSLHARSWDRSSVAHRDVLRLAKTFVEDYPTKGTGLLFIGSPGDRKTALAVGLLKELLDQRRAKGFFCSHSSVLRKLRNCYSKATTVNEQDILQPMLDADVLLVDELGASKERGFAAEAFSYAIDMRYRNLRPTLFTSNFQVAPCSNTTQTLTDRIGGHLLSRVYEMSILVEFPEAA